MLKNSFLLIVFVIFYTKAYTQEYTKVSFFKFIRPGIGLSYNTEDGYLPNSILHAQVTGSIKKGRSEFITGLIVSRDLQKTETDFDHFYTMPGAMLSYTYDLSKEADKTLIYLTGGLKLVMQKGQIFYHWMGGNSYNSYYYNDQNWISHTGIGLSVPFDKLNRNRIFFQISYSVDYRIRNSYSDSSIGTYTDYNSRMYWKRLDFGIGLIFGRNNTYY